MERVGSDTGLRLESVGFLTRALLLFVGLYAAQAMTGSLVKIGLPTVLRDNGMALDKLGLLQLLFLPWALKFLWAPVIDRVAFARFGHRRSWLLLCQLLIAVCFFVLAWLPIDAALSQVMIVLFLVAIFASTQDIAADALAVQVGQALRRSHISSACVFGGYFGFMLGLGLWLPIYAAFGWTISMLFMTVGVVILTLPALFGRSLEETKEVTVSQHKAGILKSISNRTLLRGLLFLLIYQAGLRLGMALVGPYLVDAGLSLETIGWLQGMGGTLVGLGVTAVAVFIAPQLGRKALIGCALANACVFAGLSFCVAYGLSSLIAPFVLLQSATSAFSMMTLFAVMIGWCSLEQSGTDFAVLQSADAILAIGFSIMAGFISEYLGHRENFLVAAVFLLIAAFLVSRLLPVPSRIAR